jgi:hypothetical protein
MGALVEQRKSIQNGRTIMTNTAKNSATPKTVSEQAGEKLDEKATVPTQKTGKEDRLDKVVDGKGEVLFSGKPDEVRAWMGERPTTTYVVRTSALDGLVTSMEYTEEKPSLVQRAKDAAEKLKQNKRSQLLLAGAVVCAGIAVKNARYNRKAVEVLTPEDTTVNGVEGPVTPDDTTDSL